MQKNQKLNMNAVCIVKILNEIIHFKSIFHFIVLFFYTKLPLYIEQLDAFLFHFFIVLTSLIFGLQRKF